MASAFADRIKQFDAYPKTLSDFRVKTLSGAMVTAISSFIMIVLFVAEFHFYLTTGWNFLLFVMKEIFVKIITNNILRDPYDFMYGSLLC